MLHNSKMIHSSSSCRFACRSGAGLALLLFSCATTAATVETHTNPDTGLSSWKATHPDFSLELIQVLPDYIRATYATRGLPKAEAERIASWCVFGTIVRNTSDTPLSWRLADWQYRSAEGERGRPKLKSEWLAEWREAGIPFKWTLLTDEQTFQVGDWSQGFTTYDLQHGETFDLTWSWTREGKTSTSTIEGVRCASDR